MNQSRHEIIMHQIKLVALLKDNNSGFVTCSISGKSEKVEL